MTVAVIERVATPAGMRWIRIAIPFDWRLSKNSAWQWGGRGRKAVFIGRDVAQLRDSIVLMVKCEMRKQGRFVQAKVWLDIQVEMPVHKGDGLNFIDGIADAVKMAIGVDDKWFSISRLDWRIVKTNPQIFIAIGQEATEDMQVCTHCGGVFPLSSYRRTGRECAGCREKRRSRQS